jgi:hypothetical protein
MASKGAAAALGRGLITISHWGPAAERASRTASRTRRRMRLRTTAFPIARGTVKPIRGPGGRSGSVFSRQKAANRGPVNRRPPSYTRRKSARRKIRKDLGNERSGTKNSGLMLDELGVANIALVADGQLPAALGAAAREDGAAVDRIHARAKPVSFGPFAIIRLKSTFRHLIKSARAGKPLRGAPLDTSVLNSNSSIRSGMKACQRELRGMSLNLDRGMERAIKADRESFSKHSGGF